MKTLLQLILVTFVSLHSIAEVMYPERPNYEIISSVKDPALSEEYAVITFQINGLHGVVAPISIVYSINSKVDTVVLNELNQLSKTVKPGKYSFQFFYSRNFKEIFVPKTEIKGGYRTLIAINFKPNHRENMTVKKPVIYLYPTVPTLVDVKVAPKGEFIFTYPKYNDGWKVNASPDGNLTWNDQNYNYLFWESQQEMTLANSSFIDGFVVEGKNSLAFLEEKLSQMGLNSKEKADFITFWGPQLIQNNRNFIHFYVNDECNQFAELAITPQPKTIFRLYMVYAPFTAQSEYNLMDQKLPVYKRDGFTVLEWGGSVLQEINLLRQVN